MVYEHFYLMHIGRFWKKFEICSRILNIEFMIKYCFTNSRRNVLEYFALKLHPSFSLRFGVTGT